MTDLLDELREANPVDAASLQIPAELRTRALAAGEAPRPRPRPRPPRLPLAGLLAATVCVVTAVLLFGDRADGPDLSARAYAATTGPGIVHWRTEIVGSSGGRVGSRQRTEGWARNGVTHELRYDVVHGKAILQSDSRTAGGRTTTWIRAERDYLRFPARRQAGTDPFSFGDPFAIYRRAYRAGKLTKVGPARIGIDLPGRSDDNRRGAPLTYYDIDPKTALPIRFVVKTPAGPALPGTSEKRRASETVMTFAVYEKLPFDDTTRKLLRLLPHPSGGPTDIPAAEHYAVLRTGARPDAAAAKRIAQMARTMMGGGRLDADAARTIAPGKYLLPGPKHLCLVHVMPGGGAGGGCKTTEEALKRGLSSLELGRAVSLVVPDGVTAVRARLRGRRYERVDVRGNFARLPAATFAWQFLK